MTIEEKGFRQMLRLRGRDLVILSGNQSGTQFRGTINRIGAYILSGDMGDDPRGKRILEIPSTGAPEIKSQSRIRDVKNNELFAVTNVGLDSPDYSLKFELLQLTAQDA